MSSGFLIHSQQMEATWRARADEAVQSAAVASELAKQREEEAK